MVNNESGVISQFKKALQKAADFNNRHFDDFPLGPQDRYVLADDFWATYDNFAIVESKWSQGQLRSEKEKFDRVSALCENLRDVPHMAVLHSKCHRVAWRDSNTGRLMSQEYRKGICCELFPATCVDIDCEPQSITVDEFAIEFFGQPPLHCLPAAEFKEYIKWLTSVVTGSAREIVVLAQKSDAEGYTISDEVSLDELCTLMPSQPVNKSKKKKKI